ARPEVARDEPRRQELERHDGGTRGERDDEGARRCHGARAYTRRPYGDEPRGAFADCAEGARFRVRRRTTAPTTATAPPTMAVHVARKYASFRWTRCSSPSIARSESDGRSRGWRTRSSGTKRTRTGSFPEAVPYTSITLASSPSFDH